MDNSSHRELIESSNLAASALVDFQKVNRGKICFKKHMHKEITTLRDKFMREDENISKVGAYQKALKELWIKADQDVWDSKAAEETLDIYE